MKKVRSILWFQCWKFVHIKSQCSHENWVAGHLHWHNPICMLNQFFFSIQLLNLHFVNFQEAQLFIRSLDNHISYANDDTYFFRFQFMTNWIVSCFMTRITFQLLIFAILCDHRIVVARYLRLIFEFSVFSLIR